jgi:hypothetical protein
MSQFHVSGLSPAITLHPLWKGSTLAQKYALGTLTWADLRYETRRKQRAGDLTVREAELCALLMEASDAWEAQWDLD